MPAQDIKRDLTESPAASKIRLFSTSHDRSDTETGKHSLCKTFLGSSEDRHIYNIYYKLIVSTCLKITFTNILVIQASRLLIKGEKNHKITICTKSDIKCIHFFFNLVKYSPRISSCHKLCRGLEVVVLSSVFSPLWLPVTCSF